MNQNDILQTIAKNICDIMGETITVKPEMSLRELGANSIDRADILMQTMSDRSGPRSSSESALK